VLWGEREEAEESRPIERSRERLQESCCRSAAPGRRLLLVRSTTLLAVS